MSRPSDGLRWSKFWWQDYDRDPALRRCSLEAQGFWMRVLCIMAEADPYGRLLVGGTVPSDRELARMVGCGVTERAAAKMMAELRTRGVFSLDDAGVPFCRRMVRESEVRAEARVNGAKGGNPALRNSAGKSAQNPAENSENISGQSGGQSGDINDLSGLGVNPQANPLDKPQEDRGQRQETGSLRSPVGGSRGEQPVDGVPPEPAGLFPEPAAAPSKAKPGKAEPKATRLPDDWQPGADDVAYADAKGLDAAKLAEDFRDFWHAKGGAQGRMTNWSLTWKRRCRDLEDKPGRYAKRAAPAVAAIPTEVDGIPVAAVVDRCCDIARVDYDDRWGDQAFTRLIVDALQAGKAPRADILPVMEKARQHPQGAANLGAGWFRAVLGVRGAGPALRVVA